jgi:hypothetical protein
VARPGAWHTFVVVNRSRSGHGKRTAMSASVALPMTPPSWATVVFDHVTTGAAARRAPTRVTRDNTERERMTRADTLLDRLLSLGISAVRPDYEGSARAAAPVFDLALAVPPGRAQRARRRPPARP